MARASSPPLPGSLDDFFASFPHEGDVPSLSPVWEAQDRRRAYGAAAQWEEDSNEEGTGLTSIKREVDAVNWFVK